jgi:hypothetical protein
VRGNGTRILRLRSVQVNADRINFGLTNRKTGKRRGVETGSVMFSNGKQFVVNTRKYRRAVTYYLQSNAMMQQPTDSTERYSIESAFCRDCSAACRATKGRGSAYS